jgi:hypothetical protein
MGEYVYKVTAKRVALTDGTFANLAVFAYKESFDTKFNAQMRYESKCAAADRFVKGKNFTGKVVTCYINADGHSAIVSLVAKKIKDGTFDSYQFEKSETVGVPVYATINEDPIAKIVK